MKILRGLYRETSTIELILNYRTVRFNVNSQRAWQIDCQDEEEASEVYNNFASYWKDNIKYTERVE